MRLPAIRGIIDRRILANFRVDPAVLSRILPPPFSPQVIDGFGIAGICLIRLKQLRPKSFPSFTGLSSENAAHRIAVEWKDGDKLSTGVYIPRRDTSSLISSIAGGRLFPGTHYHAVFDVHETHNRYRISMSSKDGAANLSIDSKVSETIPQDSIFDSLEVVSHFFESGSLGYSPQRSNGRFDGLELRTNSWKVRPLSVTHVQSSFFDDQNVFPAGSVTFDNALLMHGIDHEWHSRETICGTTC